jgi:hypothetical protein
MMEAAITSETSVDNYFTRQYIPEDNSELHTRRRENFKSHINKQMSVMGKFCVFFEVRTEFSNIIREFWIHKFKFCYSFVEFI